MGGKKRSVFNNWFLDFFVLSLISLTLINCPVFAADEKATDEFTLEEITVTAEKREAELQKIPMSIDVVREQEMRNYNINQIYDLQKMIPDLSVTSTVGSFNLISIREVQTSLFNPIYETTVATHLDGIQLNRFTGLDNFFFDLERVEVLKGPQGTLYGRGSTAGSMNIITRKPTLNEFNGNASVEYGNYGRLRADWAVNLPMGEKLALRLSGRRNIYDGPSDSGFGNSNSWSHRVAIHWEPTDRLTMNVSADYIWAYEHGNPMSGLTATGYYLDSYGGVEIVAAPATATIYAPEYQSGGPVKTRNKSNWAMQDMYKLSYIDNKHYGFMGSFSYDFDFATATVETGYRAITEVKDFWYGGASLWPIFGSMDASLGGYTQAYVRVGAPTFFEHAVTSSDTTSVEARLTSNKTIAGGDKFEWIVGVMGQSDENREDVEMTSPLFDVTIFTLTRGAFAQASWMPIPRWNLTAGVRENYDRKTYYGDYQKPYFFNYKDSWSELTYRANLSYVADDFMPYLTYSKGYRTGNIAYAGGTVPPELLDSWEFGFKSRFLDNRLQVNIGYYLYDYKNYGDWVFVSKCVSDVNTFFDMNTYKMNNPGDHVCDDVASEGGQYDADDPSSAIPDGTVGSWDYEYNTYVSFSPGGADMQGVSLAIDYMPTMDDRVSLSASWRKNEYQKPYDPRAAILALYPDADSPYTAYSSNPDIGGYEFGGAPIRGNINYTHTWRFGASDTLMAGGTLFYEGKGIDQYVNRTYPDQYKMPGRDDYMTGDISVIYSSSRWMSSGNMWSIRGSVQNITNSDALSNISYAGNWFSSRDYSYALGGGTISGTYINPRTYSITFSINF